MSSSVGGVDGLRHLVQVVAVEAVDAHAVEAEHRLDLLAVEARVREADAHVAVRLGVLVFEVLPHAFDVRVVGAPDDVLPVVVLDGVFRLEP